MGEGSGISVFLVDDHPAVREGLRRLLELDERIRVVGEAASGETALEDADAWAADVVLMDIRLPGMDGIEAIRRLRSRTPDLKVIVLSAFGDEYLLEAIDAGATGYMLKAASQPELVEAVVQTARGQTYMDRRLVRGLMDRVSTLSKMGRPQALSGRQREIVRLIAAGVPSKEIAARLSISGATLSRELRRVFDLLGVDDRAHAVAEAGKRRLI